MIDKDALLRTYEKQRDELVAMQGLRVKLFVFKVTAIGTLLLAGSVEYATGDNAKLGAARAVALAMAPLVGIAIDGSIDAMTLAIKQIGHYHRLHVEPVLFPVDSKHEARAEHTFVPYERFLCAPATARPFIWSGRMPGTALTVLTFAAAAICLSPLSELSDGALRLSWPLYSIWFVVCILLGYWEVRAFSVPARLRSITARTGETVLVTGEYAALNPRTHRWRPPRYFARGELAPAIDNGAAEWTLRELVREDSSHAAVDRAHSREQS